MTIDLAILLIIWTAVTWLAIRRGHQPIPVSIIRPSENGVISW